MRSRLTFRPQIYLDKACSTDRRLAANDGMHLATRAESVHGIHYVADALVPNSTFTDLGKHDWQPIRQRGQDRQNSKPMVGVVRIPDACLSSLRELGLEQATSPDCLKLLMSEKAYYFFQLKLYAALYPLFAQKKEVPIFHPLYWSLPNCQTLTKTLDKQNMAGMHIDIWDELTIKQCRSARNRLTVNVGQSDRFLLFIDLTVEQIVAAIRERDDQWSVQRYLTGKTAQDNMDRLAYDFFNLYPNYPVFKLRIAPGEAYIAPTENSIHDGSNAGSVYPDINLMIRGHFQFL